MPQVQGAPAFVRARFGLTQDLSDVGGNFVLQVRHTVALARLQSYRQNPSIQRVLTDRLLTLYWLCTGFVA
jgi:hypothetical protein